LSNIGTKKRQKLALPDMPDPVVATGENELGMAFPNVKRPEDFFGDPHLETAHRWQ
jgi:hypothetical protein